MRNTAELTVSTYSHSASPTYDSINRIKLRNFSDPCARAIPAIGTLCEPCSWRFDVNLVTQLNLPPKSTSTSTSNVQDAPTRPTLILRPRRPLWIISRQRLSSGSEYHVHWNNGKTSVSYLFRTDISLFIVFWGPKIISAF